MIAGWNCTKANGALDQGHIWIGTTAQSYCIAQLCVYTHLSRRAARPDSPHVHTHEAVSVTLLLMRVPHVRQCFRPIQSSECDFIGGLQARTWSKLIPTPRMSGWGGAGAVMGICAMSQIVRRDAGAKFPVGTASARNKDLHDGAVHGGGTGEGAIDAGGVCTRATVSGERSSPAGSARKGKYQRRRLHSHKHHLPRTP